MGSIEDETRRAFDSFDTSADLCRFAGDIGHIVDYRVRYQWQYELFWEAVRKIKTERQVKDIKPSSRQGFKITSVCKADIFSVFADTKAMEVPKKVKEIIEALDATDMERLAEKMADDYTEQLFWISLRIIFEDLFLPDKECK